MPRRPPRRALQEQGGDGVSAIVSLEGRVERSQAFHKYIRLRGFDYASCHTYFVTMVVAGRDCCMAEIAGREVRLTGIGSIVDSGWRWLEEQYPYVVLDAYVVMPNHFHGLLTITDAFELDGVLKRWEGKRLTLGRLISSFKGRTTRQINSLRVAKGRIFWQDDLYEHVIRDLGDFKAHRLYNKQNPGRWSEDEENPSHPPLL
jgi:putative transposase